jgi:hypothetical protein
MCISSAYFKIACKAVKRTFILDNLMAQAYTALARIANIAVSARKFRKSHIFTILQIFLCSFS